VTARKQRQRQRQKVIQKTLCSPLRDSTFRHPFVLVLLAYCSPLEKCMRFTRRTSTLGRVLILALM
jgi:hypothetical protein